jgi:ribA/ribD-fused uncharacterized protein
MVFDQIRTTATHVYFYQAMYSQWFPARFTAQLRTSEMETPREFVNAEQFMMARKAVLFDDRETLDRIMDTENPSRHKKLGRAVRNFDQAVWNEHAMDAIVTGNFAKFSQNAELGEQLLATGSRTLVEGSLHDTIYGVGLYWNDDRILDEANWCGTNLLGIALMTVRARLAEDKHSIGANE